MKTKEVLKAVGVASTAAVAVALMKSRSQAKKSVARGRVVIIGGGTAGITVAARLFRALQHPDVTIIEPSDIHQYQPGFTLIAAGVFKPGQTAREEKDYIPKGANWVREYATEIDPENQTVTTSSGGKIGYDYLVVAPGLHLDYDKIPGLGKNLGKDGISSIYTHDQAVKTWEMIQDFKGGNAVFTMANTAIKCGGAPQKIMYLADDYWRKTGVRDRTNIVFTTPSTKLFGIDAYVGTITAVADRKNIQRKFGHSLKEIRPDSKEAVFSVTTERKDGDRVVTTESEDILPYDLLHVVPPMSAPKFIQESLLSYNEGPDKGWLRVDKSTLQHLDYGNIFGAGDVMGISSNKTGAAVRKEAPVVVHNLIAAMEGKDPATFEGYHGYTSCPLVTGYGRVVLAEFDYSGKPTPSFPHDSTKEKYSMWLLKVYGLPAMYWHGMLRGLA